MFKFKIAFIQAALLLTAFLLTPTPRAQAEIYTKDCGVVTCSIYLTRNSTKQLCKKLCKYANSSTAVIAGAAGLACASFSGPGGVVCAAAGGVFGSFFIDKLQQVSDKNQCLRFRYTKGVNIPLGLYSDGSKSCKK